MLKRTAYARAALGAIDGVELLHDQPVVREFALKLDTTPAAVLRRCAAKGVNAGFSLGDANPELGDGLLVAITERRSRDQIDTLVETLRQAVSAERSRSPEAVRA